MKVKYIEARNVPNGARILFLQSEHTVERVRKYPKRDGETFHRYRIVFKGGGGITRREAVRVPLVVG